MNQIKPRYLITRRSEVSVAIKILLAIAMALITGLMAQVRIPLPFTPVPITGQSFAVLCAGLLLGRNWGAISQSLYIIFGVAGLPLFSNMTSGLAVLWGPTGGYLIGFIFCAYFLGWVADQPRIVNRFIPLFLTMLAANLLLIFVPGLVFLGVWMNIIKGSPASVSQVLAWGFTPFIPGLLIKTYLATGFCSAVLRLAKEK